MSKIWGVSRSAGRLGLSAWAAIVIGATPACKQNPMEDTPPLADEKQSPVEQAPVTTDGKPMPAYGLKVPEIVELIEGQNREFQIDAHVPSPGKPLLTLSGLPAGATFKADTLRGGGTVNWTPPFDSANDPANPAIVQRYYLVDVALKSDAPADKVVAPVTRRIVLIVKDSPQKLQFNLSLDKFKVREGCELALIVRLVSDDFPSGKFTLMTQGLPGVASGLTIEPNDDHNVFTLRWKPTYDYVTDKDTFIPSCDKKGCYAKRIKVFFSALSPRGQRITTPEMEWTIYDNKPGSNGIVNCALPTMSTTSDEVSIERQASEIQLKLHDLTKEGEDKRP